MSFIKSASKVIRKTVDSGFGKDIVNVTVDVGLKASNAVYKRVNNYRNRKAIEHETSDEEYCLICDFCHDSAGRLYSVLTRDKTEKYAVFIELYDHDAFSLHICDSLHNELICVRKNVFTKKVLLGNRERLLGLNYEIYSQEHLMGQIFAGSSNGSDDTYETSFNDWVFAGDIKSCNYSIYDKLTGNRIAEVTKKVPKASSFVIHCKDSLNEPLLVAITVLLDLIVF